MGRASCFLFTPVGVLDCAWDAASVACKRVWAEELSHVIEKCFAQVFYLLLQQHFLPYPYHNLIFVNLYLMQHKVLVLEGMAMVHDLFLNGEVGNC